MKVRVGFVSNSSSSSFIFKLNSSDKEPCKCCGRPFGASTDAIDLLDGMMQEYDCSETETIQEHIDNNPLNSDWIQEVLEKEGITDYKDIYIVDIAYSNTGREYFLKNSENFEIIADFS